MMKRVLITIIAASFSLLAIAGVGDKAGGSKDGLILKAMSVKFSGVKIPIYETCLNRDDQIQTIKPVRPSNRFLTTSRYYTARECIDTDRDGCIAYGSVDKEYPLNYTVRKWRDTGRLKSRQKDDDIRYLGKEKRSMEYCEDAI